MNKTFNHGYALLCGVGESAVPKLSLPTTVKDIKALHEVLIHPEFCAYDAEHIRLLHDQQAARWAIIDGLEWLKKQAEADPEATAIVYYSGHGWLDKRYERYYLLQHDIDNSNEDRLASSALSAKDFTNAVRQIQAKRLLVIIDSCHAEGMATSKDIPTSFVQKAPPDALIEKLKQGEGRVVFTSCRGEEKSWMLPDGSLSVYTYYLIEALKGACNKHGDAVVKVSHLMNHLSDNVCNKVATLYKGKKQNPYFDIGAEDFAIALFKGGQTRRRDSKFYVERPHIESDCDRTIVKPGALLRIKAPQQMGKTWLMDRVLQYAREQGYKTVTLNLEIADLSVLTDIEKFLKWFCVVVSKELGLPNQLADFWENILGCNYNTTVYFQSYLLDKITSPVVLALNNVDRVFEHPEIAIDFCKLLRSWHDQPTRADRYSEIWQKLRLVIVHSTEVYGALDINSSPLAGVGVVVDLREFKSEEIKDLAQRHELAWNDSDVEKLMSIVGGHPYLVQLAIENVRRHRVTLDRVLLEAHTEAGIYSEHLRHHLVNLKRRSELKQAFAKVVMADKPIVLESVAAFQLKGMGLIKLEGDNPTPSCELYRKYFRDRLSN
ncbi:MAG TPA: hypothetical protein DDZ80_03845 [Cyanobacteria bacterium UBA8803]|nr:hypothetical protein [Cyanobacteria bacterium UBA8803]